MEKVNASVHKTEPLFPLSSGLGIHVNRPHLCILHNRKHASYSCLTKTNQYHTMKPNENKSEKIRYCVLSVANDTFRSITLQIM